MPNQTYQGNIQSFEEALQFLDSLDVSAMKLGLSRIKAVLQTMGNPQDSLPMVHIAGTNGKGSVTAMLGAILKAAGYKVGSFTSPHLIHLRERIAINGNPILPDDFQAEVVSLKQHLEVHQILPRDEWPTFFEFLNVMAYRYFVRKDVDITLFETGLGGRLDSTNVVKSPNLTVITSIGFDHMAHLGNTLKCIAAEKAGIIKAGSPLVIGPELPETALETIIETASALESPYTQVKSDVLVVLPDSDPEKGLYIQNQETLQSYRLSLLGPYQRNNLGTVLAGVRQLQQQGFAILEAHVLEGLQHTYWPVRFQYFKEKSLVLDGSHNADGFESLAAALHLYFLDRPLIWLLSLRTNRSPELLTHLIQAFPASLGVVFTLAEPKHLYHAPEWLKQELEKKLTIPMSFQVSTTPQEGLAQLQALLQQHSAKNPIGVVTGSLYTAGAILEAL